MRCLMKMWIERSMLLLALSSVAYGQAVPTATAWGGSTGPGGRSWVDGTVHYALTASELVQLGYYGSGNVTEATNLSGNVGYVSKNENKPFTLLFAGGVLLGNQGGQGTTTYQNGGVWQGLVTWRWVLCGSGLFRELAQSPINVF